MSCDKTCHDIYCYDDTPHQCHDSKCHDPKNDIFRLGIDFKTVKDKNDFKEWLFGKPEAWKIFAKWQETQT